MSSCGARKSDTLGIFEAGRRNKSSPGPVRRVRIHHHKKLAKLTKIEAISHSTTVVYCNQSEMLRHCHIPLVLPDCCIGFAHDSYFLPGKPLASIYNRILTNRRLGNHASESNSGDNLLVLIRRNTLQHFIKVLPFATTFEYQCGTTLPLGVLCMHMHDRDLVSN